MNLENAIYEYFRRVKREVSIEELIKKFKINPMELDLLLDILYDLEVKEKVYYCEDDKKYMFFPKECLYHVGTVSKARSNNYYIKLRDGSMVIFKNNNDLNPGDVVLYIMESTDHPKSFNGLVKRVIKKEISDINYNFIIKGTLEKDNGIYYVLYNNKRIVIDKNRLHNAFVGDIVSVSVFNNKGSIIEILERKDKEHIFRVLKDCCVPINGCYGCFYADCFVEEGAIILAEVSNTNKLKIIRKLEKYDNLSDQINELISEYGFRRKFPENVIRQVNSIDSKIPNEEYERRRDLRGIETFTIDPVNAKDLDDAVSLELDGDNYILYVHTANPSYYIKFGTPLYNEAMRRCFSIYPGDDVIPMLPSELSSGVCSLNEDGDKLALTIKMVIDKNGNIIDVDVFRSIIHSNKKMDYDSVNGILLGDNNKEYEPYLKSLLKMVELSNILEDKKQKRGAICFDSVENEFILDSDGNPIELRDDNRGVAQKIIENFMLIANESIASYANNLGLPFIYRNHDIPSLEKTIDLRVELNNMGYIFSRLKNIDNPIVFQKFLNKVLSGKSDEEKKVICDIALKSMSRASYSSENIGHYGLALDCYATFTSPARKISDLLNHMIIETAIDSNYSGNYDRIRNYLINVCDYISERQEKADKLELEIDNLMLNCYAFSFIGVELDAKVLFVNSYGIYVKTSNKLSGVIPFNKGKTDMYNNGLYSNNSNIKVKLVRIDNGELIFNMVRDKSKVLKK